MTKLLLASLCAIGLLYGYAGVQVASAAGSEDERYIAHLLTDSLDKKAKFQGTAARVISMRCILETPDTYSYNSQHHYYMCIGKLSTWEYGIPPRFAWEVTHQFSDGSISWTRGTRLPA